MACLHHLHYSETLSDNPYPCGEHNITVDFQNWQCCMCEYIWTAIPPKGTGATLRGANLPTFPYGNIPYTKVVSTPITVYDGH